MAGVSFPDKKAKAKKAPRLVGKILLTYPSAPNQEPSADPRERTLINRDTPVGPHPSDSHRWHGISLHETTPLLHYSTNQHVGYDRVSADKDTLFKVAKHPLSHFSDSSLSPSRTKSSVTHYYEGGRIEQNLIPNQIIKPAIPIFPTVYQAEASPPANSGPFSIRNLNFPASSPRPIRATDIAFRPNGDAFLATLDGDIWRIEDIEKPNAKWTRVATGLFEPIAIEVNQEGKIVVLGRDGITELWDKNGDGHIDYFHNLSDAFLQTLHTRDYATSLAIGKEGSYYLAKGGLFTAKDKSIENELSEHRGTVLCIAPDGQTTTILADGLRLPYVGLRNDGVVFASDQQGNYIPSSPLHLLGKDKPFLGFEPTNFQKQKTTTPPLLWYPYQVNRSSAAFCSLSDQAFPDLPKAFLQISWNGRLFAIETPETGLPFSWQLPFQLDFPSLNGAVHPQSGRLYVTGLGISGYLPTTPKLVGLASIEQSQSFPTPVGLDVNENTITVTFNRALTAEETVTPSNPTLRLFNIKRTPKYGSGHYRWNGEPGEHELTPSTFTLSEDRKTFQATFPLIRKSDLFDLQLTISNRTNSFPIHLYTRPHHLPEASLAEIEEWKSTQGTAPKIEPGKAELGKPLFTKFACSGCHSLTDQKLTGPSLKGVGKRMNRKKLQESVLKPNAEIAKGFEAAMPSFEGVIPPQNLEHLLSYLQTLR